MKGVQPQSDEPWDHAYTPIPGKTQSTGDNVSNKNNESMNDSDKFFRDSDTNQLEDDDSGFVNYNMTPSKLQRNQKPAILMPVIQFSNLAANS